MSNASEKTIERVSPQAQEVVSSLTPTLSWSDGNPATFYYEVQISKDPDFGNGGFLYWNLVHGGVGNNSYAVPSQFPLEAGQTYYWRVRPRVQGDGVPTGWSNAWIFRTP